MLRNELRPFVVCLSNVGSRPVTRVALSLKDPQCFVLGTPSAHPSADEEYLPRVFSDHLSPGGSFTSRKHNAGQSSGTAEDKGGGLVEVGPGRPPKMPFVTVLLGRQGEALEPGQCLVVPAWIRAPFVAGSWTSQALFSYEIDGGFVGAERRLDDYHAASLQLMRLE
jgi:hypothetical protein